MKLTDIVGEGKKLQYGPQPRFITVPATTTYTDRVIHRIEPVHGYMMHVLVLVDVSGSVTAKAVNPADSTNYDSAAHSGSAGGRVALSYVVEDGDEVHSVRVDVVAAPATVGYRIIVTFFKVSEV